MLEIGQAYGEQLSGYIPLWFNKIPFLENTRNFFILGRFDILDIIAFILGGVFAFLISEVILSENIKVSTTKKGGKQVCLNE